MEKGIELGRGEGPSRGPMSQPTGTISPASRTLAHTHAKVFSVTIFTLGS